MIKCILLVIFFCLFSSSISISGKSVVSNAKAEKKMCERIRNVAGLIKWDYELKQCSSSHANIWADCMNWMINHIVKYCKNRMQKIETTRLVLVWQTDRKLWVIDIPRRPLYQIRISPWISAINKTMLKIFWWCRLDQTGSVFFVHPIFWTSFSV